MRIKVLEAFHKLLMATYDLFAFTIKPDPRIIGTFISDKDATMAYLKESRKFSEDELKIISEILGKLILVCDGKTTISTMDGHHSEEPLRIIRSTKNYIIVKSRLLWVSVYDKLIFTEDGYWDVKCCAIEPKYQEKFIEIDSF